MKEKLSILVKLVMISVLMAALFMLGRCQEEIPPEVIVDNEDAIAPQSELSQLIVRMTALDGSSDNIIDRSSCTTIVFPITGLYEDNEVRFYSLDEIVALGIEALDIEWVYPIRVILADHTEAETTSGLIFSASGRTAKANDLVFNSGTIKGREIVFDGDLGDGNTTV